MGVFGSFGFVKLNNYLEWEIAAEAAFAMPRQLGILQTLLAKCMPSCQTPAGVATCCIPVTGTGGMCALFVPGSWGTYDTGCPLFSSVTGVQAGGMGNMALLSNVAIAKAGLIDGGQLIYGGTTENMSMTAAGANTVLASAGGCYGCETMAQGGPMWKQKLAMLGKLIIAGFKE
jgi:hypothetical protein